jgi:hypothetical protein
MCFILTATVIRDRAMNAMSENVPVSSAKGKKFLGIIAVVSIIAILVAYIGGCTLISSSRNKAFEAVQIGDTEANVVARFGASPSVREKPGTLFARYVSQPCMGSCVERLWFENRLTFDAEAWSVELDQSARVVHKSHWVSP